MKPCNQLNVVQQCAMIICVLIFSNCDNSTASKDCAGMTNGSAFIDDCGLCVGGDTELPENYLMDCDGDCFGEAIENECGCVGGSTGFELDSCYGCTHPEAANYDSEAAVDDGSCLIVIDIDGNVYPTVIIGDQEWMAANLSVTHYRDGSPIQYIEQDEAWASLETGAFCYYNNNLENQAVYGNLYNWYSIDDNRGVCPEDWHVPSDAEFGVMELHLGMDPSELELTSWRGTNEGGMLKEGGTDHWDSETCGDPVCPDGST